MFWMRDKAEVEVVDFLLQVKSCMVSETYSTCKESSYSSTAYRPGRVLMYAVFILYAYEGHFRWVKSRYQALKGKSVFSWSYFSCPA